MRFFSFKILIICILFPPVLYLATAYFLEGHLRDRYAREIADIYTGDPQALMDGSVRLKDVVNQNIDHYLQTRNLISLGVQADVTVMTKRGNLIYPATFAQEDASLLSSDPTQVAAENYALMSEGLVIKVETKFRHFQLLSNIVLICYIIISVLILHFHYRSAIRRTKESDREKSIMIDRLQEKERVNSERLESLIQEREELQFEFEHLKGIMQDEKKRADRNEDDLIDEIEDLEAKLNQNLELQKSQKDEILELQEQIKRYEKSQGKAARQKTKSSDAVRKRFETLYKNLAVHGRAIRGYVELNEELQIKAEEVIHQLNQDPLLVKVKRKVFGRKGHETVFEVIFGYKGRLYFRNAQEKRIEVLAIGTKNTQLRELEFLANL